MARAARNERICVEFQPMSPEQVERTVQSLLQQQAQFAADFERLSGKTDLIADGLIGLTGLVGGVNENVGRLAERVDGLAERVDGLAERMNELTTAQQLTDRQLREVESNLNVVIQMFERHLREDHGRTPS
jgi:ABC-type transporter Mla subunit MlaD